MKPKQAKELVDLNTPIENTIKLALDRINNANTFYYWKALRWVIEAIEEMGYTVTITKKEVGI